MILLFISLREAEMIKILHQNRVAAIEDHVTANNWLMVLNHADLERFTGQFVLLNDVTRSHAGKLILMMRISDEEMLGRFKNS